MEPKYSDGLVLQFQERNLTVLVGPNKVPFLYYSAFLAARCELIDVMLRTQMKE